jgi:MFS family permease
MIPLFLKLNFVPSSLASKLRRVDWVGTVVFVGSTTSFLIPITWGGVMYAWTSWRTLVPLTIGAVGLVGFVFWEIYGAPEPLIRLSIFGNQTASISYFIDVSLVARFSPWVFTDVPMQVLHGLILWCLLYYMPLYYEAVQGYSPIIAGVALFPDTFTVAPLAVVTGISITVTGHYRWAVWSGWAITVLGVGLSTLLKVDTSIPAWIFLTMVSGVGLGILFPSMQFSLQAATTNKDMGFAVAMFSFFRTFGQAIGVAIGGVIFQNQMEKKLRAYPQFAPRASELAKDAAALVQIIKATPEGQDKLDLRTAYIDSMRVIFIVLCALAGVALVSSFFIKSYDLNRALETEQGFKAEKKSKENRAEEGTPTRES